MSIASSLPYLIAVNIVVGLLIVYAVRAFRSGQWVEEQTNAHVNLQRQIDEAQTESRKFMGETKDTLAKEHEQRRESMERLNEMFVALSSNHARHDERLKSLEKLSGGQK